MYRFIRTLNSLPTPIPAAVGDLVMKRRNIMGFLLGLLLAGCQADPRTRAVEYRSYVSPDQRFKMVVYRIPMDTTMPGQSGDAPGFVRLYDQRTGRILQQKDVEMVQVIDQFKWSSTNLYIHLFADWRLPE